MENTIMNRRWHLTKANLEETQNSAMQKLRTEAEAKGEKIDFKSLDGQNALIQELTDKSANPEKEVLALVDFSKHPALAASVDKFQKAHPEFDLATFAGQRKFFAYVGDLAFEKAEKEFLKNDDGTRYTMTFFMGPYNLAKNEDRVQYELKDKDTSLAAANAFQVSTGDYFNQLIKTLGLQDLPKEDQDFILNKVVQHQTGEGARYIMQEKAMEKGYPIHYFPAGQYLSVPGGLREQFADYSQKGYRLNAVYLTSNRGMIDRRAKNFGLRVARGTAWLSAGTALKCVEDDRFYGVKFVYVDPRSKRCKTIALKQNWKLEVQNPELFKEHVVDRANPNPHKNPFSTLRNQRHFNPENPVEQSIQEEVDMRESLKSQDQRDEELAMAKKKNGAFPSPFCSIANGLRVPVIVNK